jgi:hypothetical protein
VIKREKLALEGELEEVFHRFTHMWIELHKSYPYLEDLFLDERHIIRSMIPSLSRRIHLVDFKYNRRVMN